MITRRAGWPTVGAALSASLRSTRADESGTLTVALSDNPVTCDPINMSSHDSEILSQTIFENLVEFDIEGMPKDKLKPLHSELLKHMAETSYYTWIGYFAAANLWRDRVKNFKPSRELTINVRDVGVGQGCSML